MIGVTALYSSEVLNLSWIKHTRSLIPLKEIHKTFEYFMKIFVIPPRISLHLKSDRFNSVTCSLCTKPSEQGPGIAPSSGTSSHCQMTTK